MSEQRSLFDAQPVDDARASPVRAGELEGRSSAEDHDSAARAYATDPSNSVVLEASAGTGKTSVLVARYVNLLRNGVDPANILAITFTRKAAAEMRERIVRELRREAGQQTFDRERWQAIRDRIADIQISTIDAFCLSLLREFPLEADLDPGFAMADETEVPRIVDEALDRTLAICVARAKSEPEMALVLAQLGLSRTREGLAHLLERRLVARGVLDRFVARGPSHVTAEGACRSFVEGLERAFRSVPGGIEQFVSDGPARPKFRLLANDLRRLDAFRDADAASVRAVLRRVETHFLTQDGKPRAGGAIQGYTADDYPSPAASKRHREQVKRLAPDVQGLVRAFSRDLNVVLARGVRFMFALALAQYRHALDERALLDFSDVLERAVELLGRMEEFSQSRYRLEGRYQHVLVDEFQDTSRKQWELIALLVKAWGEGLGVAGHPSIFIVGDRKQSIYRFRDAEVAVLRDAAAFVERLRPGAGSRRSIARSLRSVPELLAFVNDLFGEVASARPGAEDFKYDDEDRFPVARSGSGRTVLGIAAGADPDDCAAIVAAEVQRVLREETVRDKQTGLSRPAAPGDIGILFRSRASHREFERALGALGIPAYVYKGLGFFDADEIKDLTALIRFLASPSSNLRAAALLRSRFVRVSDAALAALAPDLSAALVGEAPPPALATLSVDDRRVLELARANVPSWLARVDRIPPANLIEQLLPETAYAFELRGTRRAQAWENVKKLRGLIRRIQNRGYATLPRIAEYLDSLTAGDESNAVLEAIDAVNLMTVHAAKGLEFPVVFVVNISKGATGIPKPMRVTADEVAVGSLVSDIGDEEKTREHEETKRLLYVALTRARDRLYLASVLKDGETKPGRGSLATVVPTSFTSTFARAAASTEDEIDWMAASGAAHRFRICRKPDTPQVGVDHSSREAFVDLFESPVEAEDVPRISVTAGTIASSSLTAAGPVHDEKLVGTLVHRLVQRWTPDCGGLDDVRAAAQAEALIRNDEWVDAADPGGAAMRAGRVWKAFCARPDVAGLLASGERIHEVPFSLVSSANRGSVVRGAIDCLIRRPDGSIVVAEFKTGRRAPAHQHQLDLYLSAARVMYPNAAVSGQLIYPE
jgi:ATP-dependent helicase/nuclease subunit A